jgi:hypothetical protein
VLKVVQQLDNIQKGFISKHCFQNPLQVSRITVPNIFLEWIMSHTCPSSSEIVIGDRHIAITKSMVSKVIGIPRGNEQLVTKSSNKEVQNAVYEIRKQYTEGKMYPISKCEELIRNNHDEVSFMRSFMLLVISAMLFPGKDNCCQVEFLYSLLDISKIQTLAT